MAEWLKHSNMDVSLVYYPIVKKRKCSWWSAIQRKTIYCCGPGHFILAKPLCFDGKIVGSYGCSGSQKTYHTEANPTIVMTSASKVGLFVFAHGDLTIPLKFRIFQCSLGVLSTDRRQKCVWQSEDLSYFRPLGPILIGHGQNKNWMASTICALGRQGTSNHG